MAPLWLGVVLGTLLGALNAAASLALVRLARGRAQVAFAKIVLGGMSVRLLVLLAAVSAVLVALPVHTTAFVGSLFVTFVAGLAAELLLLQRHPHPAGS